MAPLNGERKIGTPHPNGPNNDPWRVKYNRGEIAYTFGYSTEANLRVGKSTIHFYPWAMISYQSGLDRRISGRTIPGLVDLAPRYLAQYGKYDSNGQAYLHAFEVRSENVAKEIITLHYKQGEKVEIDAVQSKISDSLAAMIGAFLIMDGEQAQQTVENGLIIFSYRDPLFPIGVGLPGRLLKEYLGIDMGKDSEGVMHDVDWGAYGTERLVPRLMTDIVDERWRPVVVMSR